MEGRIRFPLEVVEAVRAAWPAEKPLFVRVSAVDGIREGGSIDDTVAFAQRLKALAVDVVDCSSGGIAPRYDFPSSYGYQVPYAERVRAETGIATAAVGLIVEPAHAESIVAEGRADIVALGREALFDPNWALHAHDALQPADAARFTAWPPQSGWWLKGRAGQIAAFAHPVTAAAVAAE